MTSTINALQVRAKLGKKQWATPTPYGPDGWVYLCLPPYKGQVIITAADWPEDPWRGIEFLHASIARPEMPTYEDLKMLHRAVFPGFAYQVFAHQDQHVNQHETALHLWGRADGKPWMPEFSMGGGHI